MSTTNSELDEIMRDMELICADIARALNVPLTTVEDWTCADRESRPPMPESELKLLRYSMMTENRRFFLF